MAMDDYHEYSGLKVRKLVKIANDELDADAMYELGYRYCFGYKMRPNKRKALYWMLGAAYLDDPVAQYLVGTMYVFGEGTAVDFTEAVYWFGVAADQGHAPSLNELGIMYADGMGVEPDLEKAKEFWKKSEELGCEEAGENLKQLEEMKE
jgi:hypothetical protein